MKRVLHYGILLVATVLLNWPSLALAGAGKIAGTVLDEEKSPVIGASVQVLETQQGAAVDLDGNFVILGVVPGLYSVRFSSVGYGTQIFKDVSVSSDLTTTLNIKLLIEAVQLGDQIIEYKPPTVRVDVSSKEVRFRKEEIETRAVTSLQSLLQKQPGFKVDPEGRMHVRGGREHEVLVTVGGVDYRDPLVNSSKRLVNFSALNVEEVEVLTGGDARYGGFQSALINVTTPEGSMSDYSGTIEWRTDRAFSTYSFSTDQYDYSFSGPVPFANGVLGNRKLSFFTSGTARLSNTYTPYEIHRRPSDYLGLGFNVPERQSNDYSTFWKLTYRMSEAKKFNLTYQRDHSQWDVYPDGEAGISGNYGWAYKYNVENRPWSKNSRQSVNLTFTHNISKKTLYEISLGNFMTTTQVLPRAKTPGQFTLRDDIEDTDRSRFGSVDQDKNGFFDGYIDANRNGQFDGEGEGYDDVNRNGRWDRGEDWVDLNGNGVYDAAEPWIDRSNPQGINNLGVWDSWDPYTDINGNGRWDPAEPQLPEQDWNHNGKRDGERFVDANNNGRWDGTDYCEGYDDKNRNGQIDRQNLFTTAEDNGEPWIDGDYWFDTGEPFVDRPDASGHYNGKWDSGPPAEIYYDLPSSLRSANGIPSTNGVYDGPNRFFDEYELFTIPAAFAIGSDSLEGTNPVYGRDPRYPVLYTWEDVRTGIRNYGREWVDRGPRYYRSFISDPCPWDPTLTISTWENTTLYDGGATGPRAEWFFDRPNNRWDRGEEVFWDYNENGVEDFVPDNFLNPGRWDAQAFWTKRQSQEWSGKVDLTSQLNKYHELKSGVTVKRRDLRMNSIQYPDRPYDNPDVPLPAGSPYPERGDIRDFYHHQPWEGSAYFQDKMEFEGLIVRAGLRGDFIIQPNQLLEETQKQLDRNQPGALLAKRGRFAFAPRLGISHPVSLKSKLYFNYGHYYQTPSFEYFYRSATVNISPNTEIGNPNLEYEKTVSYEVGVNTEFTEDWVVDVAGYYRDVYNQIGTVLQKVGPLSLNRYFNLGYARARGFEFSLEKKFSSTWALTFNYDFSYAYGKESAATEGLIQRTANLPENRDEHPLGWDQTHGVSAFITFMVSEKDKPKPFGLRIPNDWLSTFEVQYGSGYPYTPSSYTTGKSSNLILANSARYPSTLTTDLKIDKFWKITKKVKLATGVEIYNLLNRRNLRELYAETGNEFDSTHELNQSARDDGNLGKDYDHNPRNYSAPRQVMLHFRLNFR